MSQGHSAYYDAIKQRFADERSVRMGARPAGFVQYAALAVDEAGINDPHKPSPIQRNGVTETVDVAIIGGGFSGLMVAARLLAKGPHRIRIIERGADFGGTWYWNRYPGAACDSVSFDYMPMLDEMGYVPSKHYAGGDEIFGYARAMGARHALYDRALFQTTVTSTTWDPAARRWRIATDRGDAIGARFVVCANGSMAKPKLARIEGMERFRGHAFHTSRWDYDYTGRDLEKLADKRVGVIGTGASAIQVVPNLGAAAKELFVFQRTPSSVQVRRDQDTDPEWARQLGKSWQADRRAAARATPMSFVSLIYQALQDAGTPRSLKALAAMPPEERAVELEQANIDYTMLVHKRIDSIVEDPATAEALKPWYMFGCKRPCIHNDYLPTFNRPNVRLVDTKGRGVTEIAEGGPVVDRVEYALDLIVYATGFEVQRVGVYNRISGRDSVDLEDKYRDGMSTYLGVHTAGFPNLFFMGGRQAAFQFNITEVLEPQAVYVANCIGAMLEEGYVSIEPRDEVEAAWVDRIVAGARVGAKFVGQCTPGYYNNEGDPHPRNGNFSGPLTDYLTFLETTERDRRAHFHIL